MIQVECQVKEGLSLFNNTIVQGIKGRLGNLLEHSLLIPGSIFHGYSDDEILSRCLTKVRICDCIVEYYFANFIFFDIDDESNQDTKQKAFEVVLYKIVSSDTTSDQESTESFYSCMNLPSLNLEDLWESLSIETSVNYELLDYVSTLFTLQTHGIESRIFGLNKLILLHGPPGSGKTSLCKALCQKIAIRSLNFAGRPMNVKLIEVDCNSLFSKWFSESGKLMTDMFAKVQSLASDPDNYVCILIDEVESISVSRKALFKGSEPSDSIRAVNVLLTQLDKIKLQSNVLVLSTSNLIETIDPAFLDRVDCCYKMGLPGSAARYRIIATAIKELMRVGLVQDVPISGYNLAVMQTEGTIESKIISIVNSLTNNSGRNINKLPFLAFSKAKGLSTFPINVWRYLACLEEIAKDNLAEGREI